jgi:hypothetical protein
MGQSCDHIVVLLAEAAWVLVVVAWRKDALMGGCFLQ